MNFLTRNNFSQFLVVAILFILFKTFGSYMIPIAAIFFFIYISIRSSRRTRDAEEDFLNKMGPEYAEKWREKFGKQTQQSRNNSSAGSEKRAKEWRGKFGKETQQSRDSNTGNEKYTKEQENIEFLAAVCRLCGYISRAGGAVTREQIRIVSALIDEQKASDETRIRLQNEFTAGKSANFSAFATCSSMKKNIACNRESKLFLIDILCSLICSDRLVSEQELQKLNEICKYLDVSYNDMMVRLNTYKFRYGSADAGTSSSQEQRSERKTESHSSSGRRSSSSSGRNSGSSGSSSDSRNSGSRGSSSDSRNSGSSGSSSRSSGSRSSGTHTDSSGYRSTSDSSVPEKVTCRADALKILGLSGKVTAQEIRKAYLKLMKEYHPDRLKAKGITGTLQREYENKCKLITEAYNYLKY